MTTPSTGQGGRYVGVAAVRPGSAPPGRTPPSGNAGGAEHKRGWQEWVRASIMPVVVAVAIAGVTPLGDRLRELIFPTRATVAGTVMLRDSSLSGAILELDGRPVGATDESGSFLLTGVDDGKHQLDARFGDSYHASVQFSVARGESDHHLAALDLHPPLNLGYVILKLQKAGDDDVFRYDLVLWVRGDAGTLRRVRQVSYQLPEPLPEDPIPVGSASAYCYRQQGTLAYEDLIGAPHLEAARAVVRLDDGAAFSISAGSGTATPPNCSARIAKRLRVPARQPGAAPNRATWPAPTTGSAGSRPPPATRPQILSVQVLHAEHCDTAGSAITRQVDFRLSADAAAATYEAGSRSGSASGPVTNGTADISLLMRCTGASDTFTFTVADSQGRGSEPYRIGVNTGLPKRSPTPTPTPPG